MVTGGSCVERPFCLASIHVFGHGLIGHRSTSQGLIGEKYHSNSLCLSTLNVWSLGKVSS